jgi:ElaB/YqjD/DUF883 family membrane-anchored ribosome-binding protein
MTVVRDPVSVALTILSAILLNAAGCSPTASPPVPAAGAGSHDHGHADHDHDHDEPESLADGLVTLASLTDDLAEKLADNAGEAADDAVHDIGHVLEELREWAKSEGFEGEVAVAATKALDELEECFGKVDEAFHTADDKADPPATVLASVKGRIEAAFESLKAAIASKEVK